MTTFSGDKGKDPSKHKSRNSTVRKATNWTGSVMDHWPDCQGECEFGPSQAKCATLYCSQFSEWQDVVPVGCDLSTPRHLAMIFKCSGHLVCCFSFLGAMGKVSWVRQTGYATLCHGAICILFTQDHTGMGGTGSAWEAQGSTHGLVHSRFSQSI